jgi:uncharacterized membrane protein YdcZ (DUF606 family)
MHLFIASSFCAPNMQAINVRQKRKVDNPVVIHRASKVDGSMVLDLISS